MSHPLPLSVVPITSADGTLLRLALLDDGTFALAVGDTIRVSLTYADMVELVSAGGHLIYLHDHSDQEEED